MSVSDPASSLLKDLPGITRRLEKLRMVYMIWLVSCIGIASFVVTFALLYFNPGSSDLRYTVTFGALLPSALVYLLLSRLYASAGKKRLIAGISRATGLAYREDGSFAVSAMARHKILPDYNKEKVPGGFQGQHRGVAFSFQEAMLSQIRQDPEHENRDKEYLRFWGIMVRIPLSRVMSAHTVVVPRAALYSWFVGRFATYQIVPPPQQRGRFEGIYEVVSSDPVEAKIVVSGSFRDRFTGAVRAMRAYWGEASFHDQDVLLAFQRFRPLLSVPPLWKPVPDKHLQPFADDLRHITDLIDVMIANPQIGTP